MHRRVCVSPCFTVAFTPPNLLHLFQTRRHPRGFLLHTPDWLVWAVSVNLRQQRLLFERESLGYRRRLAIVLRFIAVHAIRRVASCAACAEVQTVDEKETSNHGLLGMASSPVYCRRASPFGYYKLHSKQTTNEGKSPTDMDSSIGKRKSIHSLDSQQPSIGLPIMLTGIREPVDQGGFNGKKELCYSLILQYSTHAFSSHGGYLTVLFYHVRLQIVTLSVLLILGLHSEGLNLISVHSYHVDRICLVHKRWVISLYDSC